MINICTFISCKHEIDLDWNVCIKWGETLVTLLLFLLLYFISYYLIFFEIVMFSTVNYICRYLIIIFISLKEFFYIF